MRMDGEIKAIGQEEEVEGEEKNTMQTTKDVIKRRIVKGRKRKKGVERGCGKN